jgi:tetratricopeptide (TPR) repeat protein
MPHARSEPCAKPRCTRAGPGTCALKPRPAAAEAILREGDAELEQGGEMGYPSTVLAFLAEAFYEQGRYDEAEAAIAESERITAPEDTTTVCLVSAVRAVLAAQAGSAEDAERHARDAMTAVERLDGGLGRGRALLLIATALREVGRLGAAREAASRALAEFEHKGVAAEIRRADAMLAELAAA